VQAGAKPETAGKLRKNLAERTPFDNWTVGMAALTTRFYSLPGAGPPKRARMRSVSKSRTSR
jgi:hypothetical protein